MTAAQACPKCGVALPAKSAHNLCPACLLKAGFESQASGTSSPASGKFDNAMTMTIDHAGGSASAAPLPERALPQPGERFGGYQIVRILGKGGMGAVFEADQLETGRRVALKVLKHSLDSPIARQRFLREGRLAASINHPHSVYVYGTEEIDGTPAIAMELVPGGTLQERVKTQGPLPIGEAVDTILQIIAGLEAAQQLGVLHRDIKPANCFVDLAGNVKVGDFGLSISTAAREEVDVTQSGAIMGTPAFSSPEQLRGDELNVRSDMYSVGVTLYYLLTGHTPFEASNVVKLLAIVLEQPAPSPREYRPEIPQTLAAIVLRCLQKQPSERFKDYAELRAALAPFASASPTPATLGLRIVAHLFDLIVLSIASTAIQLVVIDDYDMLTDPQRSHSFEVLLFSIAIYLVRLFYFAMLEGRWGMTVGQLMCRLRVVGPDRTPPGLPRALLRATIFCLLPAVPMWIVYLSHSESLALSFIATGISWAIFFGLFSTARRSNGYAGLYELVSGTRVISHEAYQARPTLKVDHELPPSEPAVAQIGPYHVLKSLGQSGESQWLLGYDTKLLRRVWIHKQPAGAPPVATDLRKIGRIGRLRWLTGQRSETESWDAYEAVSGQPLVELFGERRPWREVRFWLLDLAEELATSASDGSSPRSLSEDQVWITSDGRAKLIEFAVPGAKDAIETRHALPKHGDSRAEHSFLQQIAVSALEGHSPCAAESFFPPRVPLPLKARRYFEKLPAETDRNVSLDALRQLAKTPAEATPQRRWMMLMAICLPVIFLSFGGLIMAKVLRDSQTRYPDVQPLLFHLMRLDNLKTDGWRGVKGHPNGPATDEEIVLVEKYISRRFDATLRDPQQWNSSWAKNSIRPDLRAMADEISARYPRVTEAEFVAGEKLAQPLLGPLGDPSFRVLGSQAVSLFAILAGVGWLVWIAFFTLAAAVLCRGGLLLMAMGLTLVRRDGKPASRLRVLWRAIVVWSPLLLIPIGVALVMPALQAATHAAVSPAEGIAILTRVVAAAGVIYLGLVIISAALPERGIPDRLAGTWLVPR